MNNKNIGIAIGIVVIIVVGAIALIPRGSNAPVATPNSGTSATTTGSTTGGTTTGTTNGSTTTSGPKQYALAEVAQHNNASSCWTAINGNVYDVTAWIPQHPGGEGPILSLCGTDGSAAFNGQHGGQARPAAELATFKIGVLAH